MADIASDISTTATLPSGSFVYGTLETLGDEDWFRFDVSAGDHYRFFWSSLTFDDAVGADLAIYNAAGALVVRLDNPGDWDLAWIDWNFGKTGTYFLAVGSAEAPSTGDYSLASNLITTSPIEALDWGTYLVASNIDVYFAVPGEVLTSVKGTLTATAWTPYQIQQELLAIQQWAQVANSTAAQTLDPTAAELTLVLDDTQLTELFGFFSPPGSVYEGIGGVNGANEFWLPVPGGSIVQGGIDFEKMLHEFGHAVGLAHPHDNGGASVVMNGIGDNDGDGFPDFDDFGDFDLNQGIYTVMSYNVGWPGGPLGRPLLPDGTLDLTYGYAGTPMAFDIALIQQKYGPNLSYHTGDDTYTLPTLNQAGTYYSCLWDAGGINTISAGAVDVGCTIDLRAATLLYEPGGGGFVSFHDGIHGGFTIANGVVIENAIGGASNDEITGNDFANLIDARLGDDTITGGGGEDIFQFDFRSNIPRYDQGESSAFGAPTGSANVSAWGKYLAQVDKWHDNLSSEFGLDVDLSETSIVGAGRNAGTVFQFDSSFTKAIGLQGEGYDLITDWQPGIDHLSFHGLTNPEFNQLLLAGLVSIDANGNVVGGDQNDTVVAWSGGSITFQDVVLTPAEVLSGIL